VRTLNFQITFIIIIFSEIFIIPGYRPLFTSTDLLLNRNTIDIDKIEEFSKRTTRLTVNFDRSRTTIKTDIWNNGQTVPMVFVCTTLWHENEIEMTTLLTSIIRLIKDVETKRMKRKDFYNIEVHILFDNVYEKKIDDGIEIKILNFYGKQFKRIFKKLLYQELVSHVIETEALTVTPYGGRLEFHFGHVPFYVHLKDAEFAQSGKRWSQETFQICILKSGSHF
jgi:hypothetical protein